MIAFISHQIMFGVTLPSVKEKYKKSNFSLVKSKVTKII